MADFVSINQAGGTVWINLDHVRKIEVGSDTRDTTHVRLTNGEVLTLAHDEGVRLVEQIVRLRDGRGHSKPSDAG